MLHLLHEFVNVSFWMTLWFFCRWFDVGNNQHALSTINLHGSQEPSTSYTSVNFALAYGEIAVSFSIGPPICGENEVMLHPIFVLRENGDVLITWAWLDRQRYFFAYCVLNQVGSC